MNRKKLVIGHLALAVVLLLFLSLAVQAKPKDKGVSVSNSFNKTTAVQSTRTMINIGNWGSCHCYVIFCRYFIFSIFIINFINGQFGSYCCLSRAI